MISKERPFRELCAALGGRDLLFTSGDIARHVVEDRIWKRHLELGRFGGTPAGGVSRPALSQEEIEARAALVNWGQALGLEPANDDMANLFLRLRGSEPECAPILVGSHIDSVPRGGKFDGAFGVLAALEALEAIVRSGNVPRRSIDLVAWTNEEGTRFHTSMMGSRFCIGACSRSDFEEVRDATGVSVAVALNKVLEAEAHIPRRAPTFPIAAFIEAHIEQGTILEENSKVIGIVTGIVPKRTVQVRIAGEENHVATTPGNRRRDALKTATNILHALNAAHWNNDDQARFTVSVFNVTPNQPFIIPGGVTFQIDLRHSHVPTHRKLGELVHQICREHAGECQVAVEDINDAPPVNFDERVIEVIQTSADNLRIPSMKMQSWAWHDARVLQRVCPTGMLFIPCKNGLSHNEAESAAPGDIAAGARVLAEAALTLANTL